jgi:hypothetical protein
LSVSDVFEIGENDTVWDAWLATVNLLDMLEGSQRLSGLYDFAKTREMIASIYATAEQHRIDKDCSCNCSLSYAEHALLKRKILLFFRMHLSSLKRFLE